MDLEQDRQEARAWEQEWYIRRKRNKIIKVFAAIAVIVLVGLAIDFITIHMTRTTYGSVEEMRAALQGRFETDYAEDIEIMGDDIIMTYYEISHYDADYAEEYGYSEYDDSVYEDTVEKWDYRHGIIKCRWMHDIIVDKDGNLIYYSTTYEKTDAPKPTPIDPSTLDLNGSTELSDEAEDAAEQYQDSLDQTEEDAEDAGVLAAEASESV